MDELIPVCGYIRVSTHMQEELSPDAQLRLLKEYAANNNMIISRIYQDLGLSGTKAEKRPGFQEMIADCRSKEHPYSAILVWKFSRFARNQEESIVYKSLLKKENVDVVSISEPLPDGFIGSLVERIFEWMDEYYSIRLSGEVRRGMMQKAIQGGYQGRMPLGYTKKHSETPVINQKEAMIVRRVFHDYIKNNGNPSDIAITLNREGIRGKQGAIFDAKKINYMITNPFYIGKVRWNYWNRSTKRFNAGDDVIVADGKHEPIISMEIWNQAQAIYYKNKEKFKLRGRRRGSAGMKHWLSGTMRCGRCGGPMTYGVNTNSKTPLPFFQCSRRSKGRCDTSSYISEKNAVASVTAALKEILGSDHIKYKKSPIEPQDSEALELLRSEIGKISMQEKRIKEAYINGIDTIDEYSENKKMLSKKREYLEEKLLRESAADIPEAKDYENTIRQSIENLLNMIESDSDNYQEISTALLEHVSRIEYLKTENHMKIFLY